MAYQNKEVALNALNFRFSNKKEKKKERTSCTIFS
jgi:hypothetical protein